MADADIDMPEASSSSTALKDKKRFEVKKVGLVFYMINKISPQNLTFSPIFFKMTFLCLVIASNSALYFHLFRYFQYYHLCYYYYYYYYYYYRANTQ